MSYSESSSSSVNRSVNRSVSQLLQAPWMLFAPPLLAISIPPASLQARLALELVQSGQAHLFASWPAPGSDDDDKHRFFKQVICDLDSSMGVSARQPYVAILALAEDSRRLLANSNQCN